MATIAEKARIAELLANIAKLGGKGMKEEDIEYTGNKLILPERWAGDLRSAITYLEKKEAELEKVSNFSRVYNYRPWDGGYNAYLALKEGFGMVTGVTQKSIFGDIPPQYIQVPISCTETAEVPWGQFQIPLLSNTKINFASSNHPDYGEVFQVTISAPRKHKFVIEGIFKMIENKCAENSIYRGKAIDGQAMPQFLDLGGFSDEKIVYSEQVQSDLDAHIWSTLRHSEANRQEGLSLKSAILLCGAYGTGKTLAGTKTAVVATENRWTFLMARPGRDSFAQVMQTARLYQPAIVFMEDVDTLAKTENQDQISQLLDLFDGIQAKSTEIKVVLTTNHPETLHKGMMRPGRLDAIIEIGALDAAGIEKLIRVNVGNRLADDVDFGPVVIAAEGYLPAFLKEVCNRVLRYGLSRTEGKMADYQITTEDLVHAAQGLRPQFEMMEEAPEFSLGDSLAESFEKLMKKSTADLAVQVEGADDYSEYVWDMNRLAEAQANGGKKR